MLHACIELVDLGLVGVASTLEFCARQTEMMPASNGQKTQATTAPRKHRTLFQLELTLQCLFERLARVSCAQCQRRRKNDELN